jgi:hypothetical protein
MIAACNTAPITSLIRIACLTFLEKLFTIPPDVAAELRDGVDFLGDWRTGPSRESR